MSKTCEIEKNCDIWPLNMRTHKLFSLMDKVLGLFVSYRNHGKIPSPKSILLVNPAHIGDVVISTSLLPVLKNAFPQTKIGFLTGSWSKMVLERHPLIDRVHIIDHWRLDRGQKPLRKKIVNYVLQRQKVIPEIREQGYEVSICLRFLGYKFVPPIWEAGIPYRLGYDVMGFAPLLTHILPLKIEGGRKHEMIYQADLMSFLDVPEESYAYLWPNLPPATEKGKAELECLLGKHSGYRVLHMGSGLKLREWPRDKWKTLARRLVEEKVNLVFTGVGEYERRAVREVSDALPNIVNACDRLSWEGLVELIRRADLVYCVETSVGHVASAVKTPSVAIYGGLADPRQWKPYGDQCILATVDLPCSPCFLKNGCESMTCLRDLSVETVWEMGEQALNFNQHNNLLIEH